MRLIEGENQILSDLEGVDVENKEYVFWDASGDGVSVAVSVGEFKSKLLGVTSCPPAFPLRDALRTYAMNVGLPGTIPEGPPLDVWKRIQTELAARPKKWGFASRLFAKKE